MTTQTTSPTGTADPTTPDTGALLEATGIHKAYRRGWWPRRRSLSVLRGAEVRVTGGEIVGLVGENGSGKSTLMKVLVGDLVADQGTVERTDRFGYCPQIPVVYERLTCEEHLDLFGTAYGLAPTALDQAKQDLYEELDFERFASTRVEELSGGTRSKLNLALAMVHDPSLLCLDEPYAGFDWDTYQRFWDLTARRCDAGASVLIISHFINDEDRFDRVYDLVDGQTIQR